ncbi:hypothetical protein KAT08_01265 [Candidatus Babeliales bacterium]|nr:hypothetical protein [Candidatus Babeliales bacterium]
MKNSSFILRSILFLWGIVTFLTNFHLFGTHNTSRYFPFLERPEEYVIKGRSHISPSLFFTKASAAFKRGGGNTGIPELWGKYDLRDVIKSLEMVSGAEFVNPITEERGPNDDWLDKSIKFNVGGKIKARGFILNYQQDLNWYGFSIGAFIPIMYVNTSDRFDFVQGDSADELKNLRDGELVQIDRIRRNVHDKLGLRGNDWNQAGFGDLDLHFRFSKSWDHELKISNIDFNLQTGVVIPIGSNSDINYPSSISFMGNGHWGIYFDVVSEFELKQDWKIGLMIGAAYQFENSRRFRLPIYKEPALFSALITQVKINPGMTFKISPYLEAQNLTDGINFHFRYTYLRHNNDKWNDTRINPDVKSYLNQEPGFEIGGKEITAEDISKNIFEKENLTRWRVHYITLQFSYDSKEAGNNWVLDPVIYSAFDYQMNGSGSCKTHQFTLGVELHF